MEGLPPGRVYLKFTATGMCPWSQQWNINFRNLAQLKCKCDLPIFISTHKKLMANFFFTVKHRKQEKWTSRKNKEKTQTKPTTPNPAPVFAFNYHYWANVYLMGLKEVKLFLNILYCDVNEDIKLFFPKLWDWTTILNGETPHPPPQHWYCKNSIICTTW